MFSSSTKGLRIITVWDSQYSRGTRFGLASFPIFNQNIVESQIGN